MMKPIPLLISILLLNSLTYAKTGLLFKISESGNPISADVILCLNGKGPLSCQNYHVTAQDLQISTTAKHHYPASGIKVLSTGYQATDCVPYPNGYCLFAMSNTTSAVIHLNSNSPKQNQTISFTSTAPSATVGGPTYIPTATATSGLPVTIKVDSSSVSICSISSGIVSFTAAGACTLNANQVGNTSYNPAPQVQQSISVTSVSASLTISSPALVLAQAGIFTNASGATAGASKSRTLIITNQGQGAATNLSIAFNPALSGGTVVDTAAGTACTNATVLAQNDSCTVTISPGTPSTVGSPPVTNTMTVTANNASNSVTSDITTLSYGSLYGDGYVFSIDDSTVSTSSVGLVKVAATSDQIPAPSTPSTYIPWDADPACEISPFECTYATGATSTSNGTNLSTPAPGGNTYLIWHVLTNTAPLSPPTFPEAITSYAAGICINYTSSSGYSDWYLPSICDMAYFDFGDNAANCGSQSIPSLQNMQSNLIDFDTSSSVASGLVDGGYLGTYWSSTESSDFPLIYAWYQTFGLGVAGQQSRDEKGFLFGVRCIRGFTN